MNVGHTSVDPVLEEVEGIGECLEQGLCRRNHQVRRQTCVDEGGQLFIKPLVE